MSSKSKFKPQTRRYVLEWQEDHELFGLEVTMRAMRMGELERLGTMWDQFKGEDAGDEDASAAKMGILSTMIDQVAGVLIAWNRMDEDTMKWNEEDEEYEETESTTVLPANAIGLRRLEEWEFMAILEGYMTCAVGVNSDLGKDSNSGGQSLVQLPMTEV